MKDNYCPVNQEIRRNQMTEGRTVGGKNKMDEYKDADQGQFYEICIQGHLDERWAYYFPGMQMDLLPEGNTRLRGFVPDPAALHGMLNRVRNLGLPLLLVKRAADQDKQISITNKELKMNGKLDTKRLGLFIAFSFGIAWALDLVIYLKGGLGNVTPGSWSTLVLLASMAAPALAHLLTRLVTREGWKNLYLSPHFKSTWGKWLLAWFAVPLLVLSGTVLFYVLWPQYFDSSFTAARQLLDQAAVTTGQALPFGPAGFIALQVIETILLAPILGSLATFGEEFGWRAYLLPKLTPLGQRKALLLTGAIWGIWHWPIIAMGYNFGTDYPGAPWSGLLGMVWFTIVVGIFFGWLTLKTGTIWPAVIGHAALNGWGQLNSLLVIGHPNTLLGPSAVGLIASLPLALLAGFLLLRSNDDPGEK
jgi:membrane protease YdiL (CAAX protease family)